MILTQKRISSRGLAGILLLANFLSLGACSSINQKAFNPHHGAVRSKTVVPAFFLEQSPQGGSLEMNLSMLDAYRSNRDHVDLREGPGVNYRLKGNMAFDEKVILAGRKGVWRKVVSLDRSLRGWVHHQRLSPLDDAKKAVSIRPDRLDQVFAIRDVEYLYSYPDRTRLPVNVPKGRAFPLLKRSGKWSLIWLSETNSLAWGLHSTIQ